MVKVTDNIINFYDNNIHPGDDIYRFVNGKWLDTVEIPDEEYSEGSFRNLSRLSEARCRELVENLVTSYKDDHVVDTDPKRVAALYSSFMNEELLEEKKLDPLQVDLQEIRASENVKEVLEALVNIEPSGVSGLFSYYVSADCNNPEVQQIYLHQGGIGLPDESYYRQEHHRGTLEAYQKHVERMAVIGEITDADKAADFAQAVVMFETKLASHHRDVVALRDSQATNNPITLSEVKELAPDFDWDYWQKTINLPETVKYLIVSAPETVAAEVKVAFDSTLEVVRSWALWRVINDRAPYLHAEIVNEKFEFTKVLTGIKEIKARWKRGLALVESLLGEALGAQYVEKYFPPTHKALMDKLVANLLEAYRQSISVLDWMGEDTRVKALEKLSKFRPKIGYPEKFRTYDEFEVKADDLLGNVRRGNIVTHNWYLSRAGNPTDYNEWLMTPQTVNAYYMPTMNEIVFPAAILQPPFFDPEADDAWNYGGIGAVIGHEIGHGFDDQGSLYDGDGKLESWWTEDDRKRFEERTKAIISQYDQYIPGDLSDRKDAKDLHVNGALTIGENIGDLGGIAIAELAYLLSLKSKGIDFETAPEIDGVTALQRLYYAWALVWQSKMRPEMAIQILTIDPHSPAEFRCNGIVKNLDSFYEAFNVTKDHALYLAPEQRVRIWR